LVSYVDVLLKLESPSTSLRALNFLAKLKNFEEIGGGY